MIENSSSSREISDSDACPYEQVTKICEEACLRKIVSSIDKILEESDVEDSRIAAEKSLSNLVPLCHNIFEPHGYKNINITKKVIKLSVCSCIVLCLEHTNKNNLWCSNESFKLSSLVSDKICKFFSCENLEDLINHDQYELLSLIFKLLRPKLQKDNWKQYPAAVSSYVWIVNNLDEHSMGRHLHLVMPTALIILDDYLASNRIVGLQCLDQILRNISKSEFDSYCSDDSIYQMLHPMIYNFEPTTVKPVISCISSVINKRLDYSEKLKWTYFDDIMGAWLSSMSMEQKLDLRAAYIECLPSFLESMGFACVRWSERLIKVFEEYSVYHKEQVDCFKAMHVFIKLTWKRTDRHFSQLIVILLKALYDLTSDESTTKNESYENRVSSIVQCLDLLKIVTPEQMKKMKCDLKIDASFYNLL